MQITSGEALHDKFAEIGNAPTDIARRRDWKDWRLGAFIHWGLYSVLGGSYKGELTPGLSEWIQFRARIPRDEYRALCRDFNPNGFNAEEWVSLIADAGCRYLVFTAKHHDGFAMYRSKVSQFNIVDSTRFGRDPLLEIAEACDRHGVALGLYYSHVIDWSEPDAVGPQCNDWDYDPQTGDFETYWRGKALPQLTELLTQYGDVGSVWFDMPGGLSPKRAAEAVTLVRRLQPDAVVNSRVGRGGVADYQSMDDNYFSTRLPDSAWEIPATTNDSWAYRAGRSRWKTPESLCETLAFAASRGGNVLLNLGPDGMGCIPPEAIEQFRAIGRWTSRSGEAIRAVDVSPFASGFEWGYITAKDNVLFAHVTDPTCKQIVLAGLQTSISAAVLVDEDREIVLSLPSSGSQNNIPVLTLTDALDTLPRLVRIEFADCPAVATVPTQARGESLRLEWWAAKECDNGVEWEFEMSQPGHYHVVALSKETSGHHSPRWDGEGLTGRLMLHGPSANEVKEFTVHRHGTENSDLLFFWDIIRSVLGTIQVESAGRYTLRIMDLPISDSKWTVDSLNVMAIRLEPQSPTASGDAFGPEKIRQRAPSAS